MLRITLITILLFSSKISNAETARVAIAANFTEPARALSKAFNTQTQHQVKLSFGSTGKLYAQITHGAPFDVFMSADEARARIAMNENLAVKDSFFIYAKGRLVLWSPNKKAFTDGNDYLSDNQFTRLAIANPKTAPYGLAAQETLKRLQLWSSIKPKLVRGESIAQAFQFVATGNTQAGLVALSQVQSWKGTQGSSWLIPMDYHSPIKQAAVLLKRGENNPAAIAWLDFLKSDQAKTLIQDFGYEVY